MRCTNPVSLWRSDPSSPDDEDVLHSFPCGKCLPCLSNKRQDWILRLTQEHKASQGALFITLTYHPKYLPHELKKRHLQLFIKRLRKNSKANNIRYYAVGEYGTKRKRPHYHILLFNASQYSEFIRKSWKFGQVHIGNVTASRIAYCTKYVVQPEQQIEGLQKPFTLMSRAYGIGGHYLTDEMVQWHRDGNRNYTIIYGVKNRLPRFYKDKIFYGTQKQTVSALSKKQAQEQQDKELQYYTKKYGELAKTKMAEFRDAQLSRIKQKVAYTEKL